MKNILAAALVGALAFTSAPAADVTPAEARAIAKEAYIYGSPMVDSYRVTFAYFVATGNPEYKGPFNQIRNFARLMTPADKAVQTPNSDTAYSFLGLDLRAEPVVITVPKVTNNRYFVLQFVDTYTHNFAYVGSTTTGNDGGSFLVVGPGWKGETPKGVKQVIHAETELALVPFRTQVFGPDDIENVKAVQAGYKAQTLSAFLGQTAPKAAPTIDYIKPLSPEAQKTSLEFFNILNFVLQFGPTHPSETELMARFAKIGVGAGKIFDAAKLSPEMKTAIEQGIADAWQALAGVEKEMEAGKMTSGDLFGTRESLHNNYLYRLLGAVWGIYGNSQTEANWLPAPKGPFKLVMRLYGPKAEALNGKWTQPPLSKVK
jgi:hypothetical protein